jgi:hypothetical protein
MLTLFACPKPFQGHIGVIQRNAIRSWARLDPAWNVVLFGAAAGTDEIARELGALHVPELPASASSAPRLDFLFAQAERVTTSPLLCYVNADVVLMGDFSRAVRRVAGLRGRVLMIGRRWDLDIAEDLDFSDGWQERLVEHVTGSGHRQINAAIDYFVFSRGLWGRIPALSLGRGAWDDWLVYRARARRASVVDATADVLAVHQNHDYGHLPGRADEALRGPETARNLELAGGPTHLFTLDDATHVLNQGRLRHTFRRAYLRRRLEAATVLHPALASPGRLLLRLADFSYHFRAKLGLALNPRSGRNG